MSSSQLFTPIDLRGVRLKNRLVVSPMCQYSAIDGVVQEYHFAHYARFALGGFGSLMVEATAVSPEGRITHGDVGLWNDDQIPPLARIAAFVKARGTVPGIQLAHAGRKASVQRPWEGDGPLGDADQQARGEAPWPTVAPSATPHADGWHMPAALDEAGLARLRLEWRSAAARALRAGFEIVEVHCAHGYLLNQFLSPIANRRTDSYGGDLPGRMRFPLEIIAIVREVWPAEKPVFVRVSAIDGVEGGWTMDDTIAFAKQLERIGVDVIDCSSSGIANRYNGPVGPGYQIAYAQRVRQETGVKSMAVGLIRDAAQAEAVVAGGQADLVALAREALVDPQWPLHAQRSLGADALDYDDWPVQSGHWLRNRERLLQRIAASQISR